MATDLTGETTELLQALIRNQCVNDGTDASGHEKRNAELLHAYLGSAGLDVQRYAPPAQPGRESIVARIEGTDPTAPRLCLMGHTDVVPVNPQSWTRDPFGGELVDGEVWGRGAIDMLNLTSSMAVAFRHLARSGYRPRGTLIYYGVADEEAGGHWGAEWMVRDHWAELGCDYVLTEAGGWSSVDPHGTRHVVVNVAEKGIAWRRLRVRGRPSHGSMPFGADSALVKAAEVVRRLAEYRPAARIDETWRAQVAVMNAPAELKDALLDERRVWDALGTLPPAVAAMCHASTHTTFSPNVVRGGQKTNIIPDVVEIEVDIRTLPGTTAADVDAHLERALGPLAGHVEASVIHQVDPSASPIGNPLWGALAAHAQVVYPGARLLPGLLVGGTDARFFREKGAVAYGAGLFSPSMTLRSFGLRFHGNDERIDVESLGLTTEFWVGVVRELLG
jgi:acetylornithine deacetylase/succinyl-diaminopimelate desuccinylase-like protein